MKFNLPLGWHKEAKWWVWGELNPWALPTIYGHENVARERYEDPSV